MGYILSFAIAAFFLAIFAGASEPHKESFPIIILLLIAVTIASTFILP